MVNNKRAPDHTEGTEKIDNEVSRSSDIEKRINEALKTADENLSGWKRAVADFENYKKNQQRQMNALVWSAQIQYLIRTLPLYDSVRKAYDICSGLTDNDGPEGTDRKSLCEGIQRIKWQFESLFNDSGLRKIETKGAHYDPATCEVVERREADGVESGTVIEEHSPGYYFRNTVMRPAKVVVAK